MQIAGAPLDQCGVNLNNNFFYLPGTCNVDQDFMGSGAPALDLDDDIANAAINAGEATIFGAEAEITWAATDNFRLDLALGYLDTEDGLHQRLRLGHLHADGRDLDRAR
jgi:outer membrane receptor protein involved in Fe transport